MNAFTGFIILTLLFGFIISPSRDCYRKKIYVYIESVLLLFIATFRSNYTSDMVRYSINFQRVASNSWSDAFHEKFHTGLYVFIKLISVISNNIHFIYFILSFLFVYAVGKLIYKYSVDPILSYLMLIPMGYFAFTLTGIAQGMSMALVILALLSLNDGNILHFCIFVVLATFFHTSALIAFLLILNRYIKFNYYSCLFIAVMYSVIYIFKYHIGSFLITQTSYRDYTVKVSDGGFFELLIYLVILIGSIFVLKNDVRENSKIKSLVYSCLLGVIFFTFVPILTEFFRIALYFNVFVIILLPEIINRYTFNNLKDKIIVNVIVYICFLLEYFGFTYASSSMNLYTC